ncbi:MAG: hypothetical protein IIA27_10015 [Gemmatimonadetes bacterium]|nr:hypothetical protein [Gemmatimonadota bacterium]
MARVRYVKTLEQVKQAAEANPEFLSSSVRSIRCVYETDAAIAAAVLPKPLEPTEKPEVCVTFSHVAMHVSPELTIEIGAPPQHHRLDQRCPGAVEVADPPPRDVAQSEAQRDRPRETAKVAHPQPAIRPNDADENRRLPTVDGSRIQSQSEIAATALRRMKHGPGGRSAGTGRVVDANDGRVRAKGPAGGARLLLTPRRQCPEGGSYQEGPHHSMTPSGPDPNRYEHSGRRQHGNRG